MKRTAIVALAASALLTVASSALAESLVPTETDILLDRISALQLYEGGDIVVRGAMRTAIDGTVYDALMQARDERSGQAPRVGGVFDLEGGGLRVVEQDPKAHVYKLAASGRPGPACEAAHVPSPCFVPRVKQLAIEDLVTESEFARTLSGSLSAAYTAEAPHAASVTEERGPVAPVVPALALAGGGLGIGAVFFALAFGKGKKKTPIEEVRAAARVARKATEGDPSLRAAQVAIDRLVARAEKLEQARRACAAKRQTIDVADLEARRARWAASDAPEAKEALLALTAELAEAARLEADLSSSAVGIERIASTLRLLPLRVREHRGTRAKEKGDDPVNALMAELETREQALAEVDEHVPAKP